MKNEIMMWFRTAYPELLDQMSLTTHHHTDGSKNPYHLEGDIWTHTQMVLNALPSENVDLILSCLLHDIGKVVTRREKPSGRVSFRYHENVSTVNSIDILKSVPAKYNVDIVKVLQFVAWHGQLWNQLQDHATLAMINRRFGHDIDYYNDYITFVKADARGRELRDDDDTIRIMETFDFFENYLPYHANAHRIHDPAQEVIFLIGLSGSGKSTWYKSHRQYEDYAVVSVDNYLQKGKLAYNSVDYDKQIKKAHAQSLQDIRTFVDRQDNVIVDMTNLTRETRQKKLSLFPTTKYRHNAVIFLPGNTKQQAYLKGRTDKTIPKEVLEKQKRSFELPGHEEFEEIQYIL